MKKIFSFIAVIAFFHGALYAQTFTGTGGSIPGIGTTPTCFSTTVSGVGVINSAKGLAQVCLRITHPNVGDLEILLKAPDGTYIPLSMQNGAGNANFNNTCFTATATTAIKFGTAPYSGDFLPEGHLGAVNNGQDANGSWSICITDIRNSGSSGVLNSFTLTFNNTPAPQPPPLPPCANTLPLNTDCNNATTICDFSGLCGSTSGNTRITWAALTTAACFGIENNSFVKFTAAATSASFSIWVNSSTGGVTQGGVQMLFFSGTCNGPVTSYGCYRHILPSITAGKPLISVITAQGLTIGNTYYIMIDGYNGATTSFTIEANSGVNFLGINPDNPTICNGTNINLTASGGNGTFSWSPATALNTTSGATVTASPTSTTTYTVSSTTPNGCPITKDVTVTVNTPPVAPTVSPTPVAYCVGQAASALTATGTNLLWYTVASGGTGSATAITPSTAATGSTTYYVSQTVNGCESPRASITVNVTPGTTPVTGFSYTPNTLCITDANPTLNTNTGFTPGGTFTVLPAAGLSIDPSTGAVNVAASSAGNYTVTYTVPATGCTGSANSSATIAISSSVAPVTGFTYSPATACTTAANPTLSTSAGFTAGGTYSATPAGLSINPTTGAINLAASSAGNYTITYAVNANGCSAAGSSNFSFSVTNTVSPITGFSYTPNAICLSGANPTLNTDAGFVTGGTFSASPAGLSINASTGAVNVAGSSAGNYTITYSVNANGCTTAGTNTTTVTINSNIVPVTDFSYSAPSACKNETNPVLTKAAGFTTGGTFFAFPGGLSLNATTGDINLATSSPGNYTITYSVDANGCLQQGSSQAIFNVYNNVTPVTGFSYQPATLCTSSPNPALNKNNGFTGGGTYAASPAGLSIDPTTGEINVAASTAGVYTITYTLAASGCTLAGSNSTSVTINSASTPVTGFSYAPNTVCANEANPTLNPVTGFTTGGTYTAPAGLSINANTGAINVAASTAGTYTITYTVAATGCAGAGTGTATFTINANTNPVTGFSYTPNATCASGTLTLQTDPGFITGGTFSSTAGLSLNGSTGAIDPATSTVGNYTVTYNVPASGCRLAGQATTTVSITNIITPNTTFSYTPAAVCANGNDPALTTPVDFVTGGNFSATPAGLSINANTGAINIVASTPGNYTITYSIAASGCYTASSSTSTLTINSIITPVTGFSYDVNSVCANGTNPALSTAAGFTTGGVFSATPAGLSINASTGAINVAASTAGSYTIRYDIAASGCTIAGFSTANFTINANTNPVTGFSYTPGNVCANGNNPTINSDAGFTTGGTFTATPAGLNINPSTGAINVATSTAGNYTVSYDIAASGCRLPGNNTANFIITAIPAAAVTQFSYTSPVCKNDANPVPVTANGFTSGGVYSSTNGLVVDANTGIINLTSSTAGTYTITYSIAATLCSPLQTGTTNITINPTPAPPDVSNNNICGPGVVALSANGTTGTVRWYDDAALTNLVNTGTTYNPSLTVTTVYRVTETVGLCTSNPAIVTATIGVIPGSPFLGNDTAICQGDRLTLDAGSYTSYTWQDGSHDRTYVVSTPGFYSVQVTNGDGCTNSGSITVSPESDCSDIYFPSAFAPDGKNNLFGPVSPSGTISGITKYSLTIYNRYGQVVFISTNPLEKWDGTFKGKKMGTANFVWYSTYLYRGRAMKKQKGSILLIR
ncbi:MAG: gliding motility-associated C-terminal domain-containing protein [Ferruginibacter sp.]